MMTYYVFTTVLQNDLDDQNLLLVTVHMKRKEDGGPTDLQKNR
jgi:hypothetical protein